MSRYFAIPAPDDEIRQRVLADPQCQSFSPVALELYLISIEWCAANDTDRFPKWMVAPAHAIAESRCRARGEI